jgi:2-polyprenyl-3-methyl-5-hydroxy-6-metoxy-1,4-benzoquinol methylase
MYWDARAVRFAGEGQGLRAICSYGMPGYYNKAIDLTQRMALRSIIRSIPAGAQVLDYGCGVGRWSREIARRGAHVTGIDFSEAMLQEAARRTAAASLAGSCRYLCADVATLELSQRFDVIIGVTVLQHLVSEELLARAIGSLARHLKPGGRLILLEAAPCIDNRRANSAIFRARPLSAYLARIAAHNLVLERVRGVDFAAFKLWVVPRLKGWPPPVALSVLALATLCAVPLDLLFARWWIGRAWHQLIVAKARGDSS